MKQERISTVKINTNMSHNLANKTRNICQDEFSCNLISRALLMLTQLINSVGPERQAADRSTDPRAVR